MPPPRLTEGFLRPVSHGVLGMVLVIIHHTAEAGISQRFHIGGDTLVGGALIAEEPPRLHTILRRRVTPQPRHALHILCAGAHRTTHRHDNYDYISAHLSRTLLLNLTSCKDN